MASGWIGLDWLQDKDKFPLSQKGWQTSLARGNNKVKWNKKAVAKELKLQKSWKNQTGLDWNRDVLNQAGQGWKTNFLPGASASSIHATSKLSEAQQIAKGFAEDYGGYVSPEYATKYATTGAESVIDAGGITGDAATSGGAAPNATPWGAISLGLNLLARVFDKSKPGQPAPTYTASQYMGRPDDWSHFFSSSSRIA